MNLYVNDSLHWQISGGGELHSGDRIEVYLDGEWVCGWVTYRPKKGYTLTLDSGTVIPVTDGLRIRLLV